MKSKLMGRGYETMFPFFWSKIYFDGCDVADDPDGWGFLEAAALTFCGKWGGYTLGWTSAGFGMPSVIPFIGGHTEHLWGDTRYVFIDAVSKSFTHWSPEEEYRKMMMQLHLPRYRR